MSTKYWPAEGAFVGGSGAAVVPSREKKDIFLSMYFVKEPNLTFNPFNPKNDQFQIPPTASPEILHDTV